MPSPEKVRSEMSWAFFIGWVGRLTNDWRIWQLVWIDLAGVQRKVLNEYG